MLKVIFCSAEKCPNWDPLALREGPRPRPFLIYLIRRLRSILDSKLTRSSPTMHSAILALLLSGATIVAGSPPPPPPPPPAQCKSFPGDKSWPSTTDWSSFNKTINGRLVATVPLGTPCHGSAYNSATCENLKSQWQTEQIQYVHLLAITCIILTSTAMTRPHLSWHLSLPIKAAIHSSQKSVHVSLETMSDMR